MTQAIVTYANVVSQSWQNIFDLIDTRANVTDPIDATGARKMVYTREPYQKSRNFGGYPYIIVHPVTADFNARSVSSTVANVDWEIEVEVHSSDNMLHKDHKGNGNAYANQICDDIIQTLNNETNRKTLRNFGMAFVNPALDDADIDNIGGETIFTRSFRIPFNKRLTVSA